MCRMQWPYKKACVDQMLLNQPVSTTFSGLSDKGDSSPDLQDEEQLQSDRGCFKRNKLIAAARKGDEGGHREPDAGGYGHIHHDLPADPRRRIFSR